jgi:hypothetical protein
MRQQQAAQCFVSLLRAVGAGNQFTLPLCLLGRISMDSDQPDLHIEGIERGAIPSFSLSAEKHEMKVLLPHLHTSRFSLRGTSGEFFFHLAAGFDCSSLSRVIRCEADCVSRAGSASFTDGRDQWRPGRVLLNGSADEAAVSLLNAGHKAR